MGSATRLEAKDWREADLERELIVARSCSMVTEQLRVSGMKAPLAGVGDGVMDTHGQHGKMPPFSHGHTTVLPPGVNGRRCGRLEQRCLRQDA
jgi:hypothetical protein